MVTAIIIAAAVIFILGCGACMVGMGATRAKRSDQ